MISQPGRRARGHPLGVARAGDRAGAGEPGPASSGSRSGSAIRWWAMTRCPAIRLAREAADALGLPLMVHVIDMRPPTQLAAALPRPRRRRDSLLSRQRGRHSRLPRRGVCRRSGGPASAASCSTWVTAPEASPTRSRAAPSPRDSRRTPSPATCTRITSAGPAFDQATTLSKLLHVGHGPGRGVSGRRHRRRPLAVGVAAAWALWPRAGKRDLTVFELRSGPWALPDAAGVTEIAERLIVPVAVLRAGELRHLDSPVPASLAAGRPRAGRDPGAGRGRDRRRGRGRNGRDPGWRAPGRRHDHATGR